VRERISAGRRQRACRPRARRDLNDYDAYSLNSITAAKQSDGSIAIRFGGCDGKAVNCLPIMKGWNYTVRLYRPRPEILTGKWSFPPPQPAN